MKIGMIQSPVTASKEANLANAEQAIARAAADGADIAVLPEMFNCPYYNAAFVANAEPADGESVARLRAAAAQNGVYLVGGSIPLLEEGHIYNASFVFDRAGRLLAVHKKVHLFDIAIDGGQVFQESATFTAGDAVTVFDTEFGKMGLCICFDFRFPELARLMALEGARCIFVPAAFNMTTGPAHWELMFRQRAVDNQLFTVGVAPARSYEGYVSYANSMVVSPWGDIIYRAEEKPALAVVDLDLAQIDSVRRQLPLLSARRTDLYAVSPLPRP